MGSATVAAIDLNAMARATLIETLGIEIVEVRDDALVARMPVDHRTVQPAGVLHGGASVALAETLASWAGYLAVDREQFHVVGQEINANHIRPVFSGWVTATATPAAIGRRVAGVGDPHRRRRRQARVHLAVHARRHRAAQHLRDGRDRDGARPGSGRQPDQEVHAPSSSTSSAPRPGGASPGAR